MILRRSSWISMSGRRSNRSKVINQGWKAIAVFILIATIMLTVGCSKNSGGTTKPTYDAAGNKTTAPTSDYTIDKQATAPPALSNDKQATAPPAQPTDEPAAAQPGQNTDMQNAAQPGQPTDEPVPAQPGQPTDEPVPAPPGQSTDEQTTAPPAQSANEPVAAQSANEPATAALKETAHHDEDLISFQYNKISPIWKEIGVFGGNYDFTLVEDGQGTLHLIYNDYSLQVFHCIQNPDGSWSEPRQIIEAGFDQSNGVLTTRSMNKWGYWVGTAPDGSLCFAWKEDVNFSRDWIAVLRISYFKDGQWQEEPKLYDFNGGEGLASINISWFSVSFDTQGEPHFFYRASGDPVPPGSPGEMPLIVEGLFLDGQQLIQEGLAGIYSTTSLIQGVGDLASNINLEIGDNLYFYIDGKNVYHLIGSDSNYAITGYPAPTYSRCIHSYSSDGGKTWKGPFTLFDGDGHTISTVSFAEDSKGNLNLMAHCPGSDEATLLLLTLAPDSYTAGAPDGYFGSEQMQDDLWAQEEERWIEYTSIDYRDILFDNEDKPHFTGLTTTMTPFENPYYDITQIKGNAWAIRDIEKPDGEYVKILAKFLRRNGNFILLASESGVIEPTLFLAEIPAK